jgi:hypothetical protein
MSKVKKQEKKGQFIEQQLDKLKDEQLKSMEVVETVKDNFAGNVEETIEANKGDVFNSDYFAEAFRKIDADRISTQIEMDKIDEEIEAEEQAKQLEEENKKKALIEQKLEEAKNTVNKDDVVDDDAKKDESTKMSFFDKLLKVL